ncbi:hypothetical protein F5Y00DRAFT_267894 [Daldinia vernicosa]|uniref:uncharacterized protein n=1 Tax=Daldinia vernicosa TaxID=114800 RepID=UPI00200831C9|nr:uncharacterized protein F5Y00DRAFT_267894 [Daldinia vernicosa]KAI0851199.1 hypothetical protein F5Y00DRAFT_267894 [Daldinia vernicosa]
MPPLPPGSGFDIFCHIILVVYLAIFIFFNARQVRNLLLSIADMMDPQTPRRKLFKPSSIMKTPTSSTKQRPTTSAHSSFQSHEVLTPTETVSRSTDTFGGLLETTTSIVDNLRVGEDASDRANDAVKSIGGKPREILNPSTSDLPESSTPTDTLNSPTDLARYFAEQGNSEMSTFISALTGRTQHDQTGVASNGIETPRADTETKGHDDKLVNAVSESIKQLPSDDASVVSPNERTKEILENLASDIANKTPNFTSLTEGESKDDDIVGQHAPKVSDTEKLTQDNNIIDKIPDHHRPADISKEAEGATGGPEGLISGAAPTNIIGEPNTGIISEEAHIKVSSEEPESGISARDTTDNMKENPAPSTSVVSDDDTQVADNMDQPAHIERRIEIPLPRPEKTVRDPSEPAKPEANNIPVGLGDPDELPDVQGLPGTDELQDPPEEVLDPSVHSPSSSITPIPKIPKITPIGMAPPPDLLRLAHGLSGGVIDDVGSIVDTSGKVLGHATGDLPAMVGRTVADNGEVYGESGEVIGYVSENFTGPPPPVDIPENVLEGLKIDHDGNILDTNGNIIGRFNEKAEENENLASFMKRPKPDESQADDRKPDDKKPKVNAHTGGSPSDIFLDVKSTTDGIQLTIRIPTTFGRQPQDS